MYKNMVLCITEVTPEEVVRAAIKLCSSETEVHILHVVHLLNDFVREEVSKRFAWAVNLFREAGVKSKLDIIESTKAGKAIVSFAKEISSDVIVTGTIPRRGLLGHFVESVSDYIVKNAPCTVILIRKSEHQ